MKKVFLRSWLCWMMLTSFFLSAKGANDPIGESNLVGFPGGKTYLYRLTNTAGLGFGFTSFTGTSIKEGQFFIACSKKPDGAGRLNMVWLDEYGNVESETTGIETIESNDADNGAIYNLQGIRIVKPQKGIYIQKGRKIVVK